MWSSDLEEEAAALGRLVSTRDGEPPTCDGADEGGPTDGNTQTWGMPGSHSLPIPDVGERRGGVRAGAQQA